MRSPTFLLVIAVASISGGTGFLFGQESVPYATELTTARSLSRANVNLIGFDCGDHRLIAVAEYEDEFPDNGCKEIRKLDDKRPFL